jgi:glyoxylase-like metal-dependent hydrolase (beta-lactamase superfamily II)
LAEAKRETAALSDVQIHLPSIVIESDAYIHLGDRSLYLTPLPGHTRDSIGVMIEGDRILFAGDAVLPVPYIVWGDAANSINSLRTVRTLRPESVVQGHGDLLLRGELGDEIESSVHYIEALVEKVQYLVDQRAPQSAVAGIDIESCGKSRVPLDGLVQHLHRENAIAVYHRLNGKPEALETQPLF